MIFIGTSDLSFSLGLRGAQNHSKLDAAVAKIVAAAKKHGAVFEMCLTSNVMTHAVDRIADHPFPRLLRDVRLEGPHGGVGRIEVRGGGLAAAAPGEVFSARFPAPVRVLGVVAGNALVSDYVWTFTTEAAGDTTPPAVSATTPADGAMTPREMAAFLVVTLAVLVFFISFGQIVINAVGVSLRAFEIAGKDGLDGIHHQRGRPSVVLALWAGHAADRYDRRRILIACYGLAAASAAAASSKCASSTGKGLACCSVTSDRNCSSVARPVTAAGRS